MSILRKLKRAIRGEVKLKTLALEVLRRARSTRQSRFERSNLDQINEEVPELLLADSSDLLAHFRNRVEPQFFSGFSNDSVPRLQKDLFPYETERLLNNARQIVDDHSWQLLGFGLKNFGQEIEWCRDPLSGYLWPLEYHRDIQLIRNDGSDARVLWEVNRLGHLITLACAYKVSGHEQFSKECVTQLHCWATQNPYGRGINWTCAMEVALRAMNLLAVFEILRTSTHLNSETLQLFLRLFHQHGTYIRNNLEFSYIATSNHYLSDLAGLLWLGIMLPEFHEAENWRDFALVQMLREMDKQVLPDGADFESSTGYHRFVVELFLYSFILCKRNELEISAQHWNKLHAMLEYLRGYLRPDGLAPLIGDSDSGQVLPICRRRANDHAYVLAIGAASFTDANLRPPNCDCPPELLWMVGEAGLKNFQSLDVGKVNESKAFPYAGTYVMRRGNLYLCFNASGAGVNGRGSHGHNDALSIEISAGGRPFIVDPGSYVYTADLHERHLFRSTAYHSTVKIDGEEQNSTQEAVPFVIGDEAKPRVLEWETGADRDKVVAEHSGYARLPSPVIHRRTIVFEKAASSWLIEDDFVGQGDHSYEVRFHFAPDLEVRVSDTNVVARDKEKKIGLKVTALNVATPPVLEIQETSQDYGEKAESMSACWRLSGRPVKLGWRIQLSDML